MIEKVLDGQGWIRLVDVMGSDARILEAARQTITDDVRTRTDDHNLLRYLMRHHHSTPFEFATLCFEVYVPMDTWRQWIRHRTASVNEYSTRYSPAIDDRQTTAPDKWRTQAKSNRQGSGRVFHPLVGHELSEDEAELHQLSQRVYTRRLEAGVAKEQARKDLPLSTFTKAYWQTNLHNLLHFLRLRMDPHAQQEIREYANAIATMVEAKFPMTYEAFSDYRLNAVTLSKQEASALGYFIDEVRFKSFRDGSSDSVDAVASCLASKRERTEFAGKLNQLFFGIDVDA